MTQPMLHTTTVNDEQKPLSEAALKLVPKPEARYMLYPSKYTGPRAEDVLAQRQMHLSAGQYHFYKKPLMLVEASMQYCFDDKGNQYLDCYSNVCHVGHCHPYFVKMTSAAMHNIISNTRYLHPKIVEYAERLKAKFPPQLSVCYFVNSGSEANDLAMRLARVHTKRQGIICLQNAYHGTTASCTGVSTSLSTGTSHGTVDYDYCARDVYTVPVPDVFRGPIRGDDPECGAKYAAHVRDVCAREQVAAFIHESVQGVGGQVVYPRDYLRHAYSHVRNAGGVTIADEVQTGFGRSGSHFWAFEAQGVVPDIVTLGKPIGNGFPLGAVITTRAIAQSFDGVQYFNTNGGNPVACAAGLAVLDIIERDRLQQCALEVSHYLMERLLQLKAAHQDAIGDVRGVGLFIGIELVKQRGSLDPATDETAALMEMLKGAGLLVGKGGQFNNVLRIKPPLCFNKDNCDYLVRALHELIPRAFREVGAQRATKERLAELGHDSYLNCASPASVVAATCGSSFTTRSAAKTAGSGIRGGGPNLSHHHRGGGSRGVPAELRAVVEQELRRSSGRTHARSDDSDYDSDEGIGGGSGRRRKLHGLAPELAAAAAATVSTPAAATARKAPALLYDESSSSESMSEADSTAVSLRAVDRVARARTGGGSSAVKRARVSFGNEGLRQMSPPARSRRSEALSPYALPRQ